MVDRQISRHARETSPRRTPAPTHPRRVGSLPPCLASEPPRSSPTKDATRRASADAAAELFRAQGYADTHLADITAFAGIGRTTIYEYFTDKEDVLVNLVEDAVPSVVAGMLADLPEDLDMRERLAELIQRGLSFVSTDHALGSMVMRELRR